MFGIVQIELRQNFEKLLTLRPDLILVGGDVVHEGVTLTDEEIEWYVQTDEPFDKAGAYAIQGIGTFLVKRINGSYTSVVGLPVCEVLEYLINEGAVVRNA